MAAVKVRSGGVWVELSGTYPLFLVRSGGVWKEISPFGGGSGLRAWVRTGGAWVKLDISP